MRGPLAVTPRECHSRVSREWDVASGRNRSAQLQLQTV